MVDRIVIDASVVAKWFLKDELETDVDLADRLLGSFLAGDGELHAPNVLRYEICGLLTKACRVRLPSTGKPRLNKADAIGLARDFFFLPIQFHELSAEDEVESMEMGIDHGKSYYDMTYICLAKVLGCKCCLADQRALGGVGPTFPFNHVVILAQLLAR
jgi:predicted nucleic acid-binding protein